MMCGGCLSLLYILFLLFNGEFAVCLPDSNPNQDASTPEQVSCLAGKPVRSIDSLYLGSEDQQNSLRLEFQLSEITSNLSSFELRTRDPEGVIFYGDIGEDNWFVLGVRQKKLEVQMSNSNGQMVLSKWGPEISDGKWKKVAVDSSINTIEVRMDGELVVKLTHHVNAQLMPVTASKLVIILGDLPVGRNLQLIRPLKTALDGCMRNWAWVKRHTEGLENAMETDENRRCFEKEEPGSFFPSQSYAIMRPNLFQAPKDQSWKLSIRVDFRFPEDGVLLALRSEENVTLFLVRLDWQKRVVSVTFFDKLTGSVMLPVDLCPSHWQFVDIQFSVNTLFIKTAETMSFWDIQPTDFQALQDKWTDPTSEIYIGGVPGSEGPHFSGCLKITLQAEAVDLDMAHYKHPYVRSHSCPVGI
uniref:Laminin G domain-containing protein n=1 Tax=Leptobrachium leishanense TaxID=445787 RepID=A0A8C5MVC0_9ANUR